MDVLRCPRILLLRVVAVVEEVVGEQHTLEERRVRGGLAAEFPFGLRIARLWLR